MVDIELKQLPHLTDEELGALLFAVQVQLEQVEGNLLIAQSKLIRSSLQRRWTTYNSLRTAIAETKNNPTNQKR